MGEAAVEVEKYEIMDGDSGEDRSTWLPRFLDSGTPPLLSLMDCNRNN
jgi:hypothetical protein